MGLFDGLLDQPRARSGRASLQLFKPTFTKPEGWDANNISLPELSGIVALDAETLDPGLAMGRGSSWPHRGQGRVCGWAVSSEQGDFYLPIDHADGNMDRQRAHAWLLSQLRKPDVTAVFANCQYDMGWMWREGLALSNPPIDVQGMAALLDEFKFNYGLDALAREYLGERKGDEEFLAACRIAGLNDPKSRMDLVPAWVAAPYGMKDAALTRALYHKLKPMMDEQGLNGVHDLERDCYIVGYEMKKRGVRVDLDKAEQNVARFRKLRDEQMEFIRRETGVACSATDLRSLAQALKVENPDLDLPKTARGDDSMRKDFLATLKSPVADAINKARKYDKACGTFFESYILEGSVNGRIHCDFNPLKRSDPDGGDNAVGTTSGRWSATDPNLQNVPTRDEEIGPVVRECFLPEEDEDWGKLDYSAQEPRLGVHFAELLNLRGAREMGDRFRKDPKTDLHAETAALMNVKRTPAKTINLAIWYGAGGAEIARRLGLPTAHKKLRNGDVIEVAGPEAERLIATHMANLPFIKGMQKAAKEAADRRGWVRTLLGRRVRFQRMGDEYARTYKACNSVIQGSAADQMKAALRVMLRRGIIPLIIVHDDANVSIPRGEAGAKFINEIKGIMESAVSLTIPVLADVKIGANWAKVSG